MHLNESLVASKNLAEMMPHDSISSFQKILKNPYSGLLDVTKIARGFLRDTHYTP